MLRRWALRQRLSLIPQLQTILGCGVPVSVHVACLEARKCSAQLSNRAPATREMLEHTLVQHAVLHHHVLQVL
eukprot:CAMPEP_0202842480 /NCGR_PEP_ID=MMETSP1389-20130828/61575_1 /ASSEMBLY_ACC=CAM_ASM_000865 /TAXON_ID=302021 /ORGANISM="Rhodomonas sp., Strain CCMP768" /LENGTH=72 /DNA_ID=CAMNT_0049519465 /DNA_START=77 /DNA_END=292 /DNA_ORIENTATION=-